MSKIWRLHTETGRATFLAALVVLSVFALSTAFAVAAADPAHPASDAVQTPGVDDESLTIWTYPASEELYAEDADTVDEAVYEGWLTQRDEIALTEDEAGIDGLVVSLKASELSDTVTEDDTFADLADRGIYATITRSEDGDDGSEGGDDQSGDVWGTDDSIDGVEKDRVVALDVLVADDSDGEFVFGFDSTDLEDESDGLDTGTYDLTLTFDDGGDHVDEPTDVDTTFSVVEGAVEWDDTAESLSIDDESPATGTATLAPGTEVEASAESPDSFSKTDHDVTVREDGGFTATFNFADQDSDEVADLRVEASEHGLEDVTEAVTVWSTPTAALDPALTFEPDAPEEGEDVDVTLTFENVGDGVGDWDLELVVDGDTAIEDSIGLDPGENTSVSTTALSDPPSGEYEWELLVNGVEEDAGTLGVAAPSGSNADDEPNGENGDADDGSTNADSLPGFGVGITLISLLAATIGVLRSRNRTA